MKFGMFVNPQPFYKKEAKRMVEFLKCRKIDYEVYRSVRKARCDILIVVGGDGTILRAVMD